ncbi:hypothetical protein [Arsenicibacter rosenii]|uniref:N-acetyltransferase domain-containing protein n=1 Tax=Arsenicibacter rosenii TaxID=1750698 RepID=A0A1S2VPG4_9BACT|nr:hypothetical protein [Arsenicibacter rosenii]OIN60649.1 hypothetical protein BLX24_00595 [Arsenicibacter rosenii]
MEIMTDVYLTFDFCQDETFQTNAELKNRLYDLISQSYINVKELIDRIYIVNDIAFVARHQETIVGILFYSFGHRNTFYINDEKITAIYNGYAVTDLSYRNNGVLQKLIQFSTTYFCDRIKTDHARLLLYAITSNPFALRAYRKVCPYLEPFENGSFTDNGRQIARQLKQVLGINRQDGKHPFTFNTTLPQRYSDFEQQNLRQAPEKERSFLQALGVDEQAGDRIIFFWLTNPLPAGL